MQARFAISHRKFGQLLEERGFSLQGVRAGDDETESFEPDRNEVRP